MLVLVLVLLDGVGAVGIATHKLQSTKGASQSAYVRVMDVFVASVMYSVGASSMSSLCDSVVYSFCTSVCASSASVT